MFSFLQLTVFNIDSMALWQFETAVKVLYTLYIHKHKSEFPYLHYMYKCVWHGYLVVYIIRIPTKLCAVIYTVNFHFLCTLLHKLLDFMFFPQYLL